MKKNQEEKSEGLFKYIPKKILYALGKYIDPRVVCSYKSRDMKGNVGLGVGLYINKDNISKGEYKTQIIDTISNLKEDIEDGEIKYLIEDEVKLNIEDITDINEKLDINIELLNGKRIFAENMLACLKEICRVKDEELSEKEVFIISDDTKITEKLINELALSTKFISLCSKDINLTEKLELDILKNTGLALNVTKEISKCSDNFDFIINLNENTNIDILNIKKNNIVFDLSNSKCLSASASKGKRKAILIDDLFFENDKDIYSDGERFEFNNLLNTSLSDMLNNTNSKIEKIRINQRILDIEEGLALKNLEKQNQSCFKKIE